MAARDVSIVSLGVANPFDQEIGLGAGDEAVYHLDDALRAYQGSLSYVVTVPLAAQITGGYWTAAPTINAGFIPPPDPREEYLQRIVARHQQTQGRYFDKTKPHEMAVMAGGEGWSHVLGGNQATRIFIAVTKKEDPANPGRRLRARRVRPADEAAYYLQVLRSGRAPALPRHPTEAHFIVLDYEFALRRGLLLEDPTSGEVCVATDYVFVDKGAFVRGVGPRNLQRSLLEPSKILRQKDEWTHDHAGVKGLPAAIGPIIAPFRNDEDFFLNCLAVWAMGTARQVKNLSMAAANRPPDGDNPFERIHNRHAPADPNADPIGNWDTATGRYDLDAADATEMYYVARRLALEPEDVQQLNPWRAEQEVWINEALRIADLISEKKLRKEIRRGHFGFETVDKLHTQGGFYMQSVGWVRPWRRRTDGVWEPENRVLRYAEAERLGIEYFTYGWSESGEPELAWWWLRGALEDVYEASRRTVPNRDRDPEPWRRMYKENPFNPVLGPDFLYTAGEQFATLAQWSREKDSQSRQYEVAILYNAEPDREVRISGNPTFQAQVKRVEQGMPAGVVFGSDWMTRYFPKGHPYFKRLLRNVWQETKDMIFGHVEVRAGGEWVFLEDVAFWGGPLAASPANYRLVDYDQSIWALILRELRHPIHSGRWNDLADLYEWRVKALVQREEVIYA